MTMLQDMGSNPQNMSKYLQDPRLQQAMSVGLGINMMSGDDFKKGDMPKPPSSTAAAQATQDGAVESDDDMPVGTQLSCYAQMLSIVYTCTGVQVYIMHLLLLFYKLKSWNVSVPGVSGI